MNIYRYSFFAICPSTNEQVVYDLQIKAEFMIAVEMIIAECKFEEPTYHEIIADQLIKRLGGRQVLIAQHNSVKIETRR